jgi:phosphoribosylformylglycinamidine cyclo-ligase
MYQVFNMGCRLEIYTDANSADRMISIANDLGIDARVIGRVEESESKSLEIKKGDTSITYQY